MVNIQNITKYFKGDKYIWTILIFLTVVSLLSIYSATSYLAYRSKMSSPESFLFKQFAYLCVGIGITYIVHLFNYRHIARVSGLMMIVSIILLVFTIIWGENINEARRAISIPFINLSFQTADFARLSVILFLTKNLATIQDDVKNLKHFVRLFLPIAIICLLIALGSLSSGVLLFITCMVMLFIGRVSLKYLAYVFILGVASFGIFIFVLSYMPNTGRFYTWKSRVENFVNAEEKGESYQMKHAKMAVASGGLLGRGPGNSRERNILPNAYDDFIYSIIIEEYGLIGGFMVMFAYLALLYRATRIVIKSPKAFGALLSIGIGFSLAIQAIVNMGVNTGFFPLTGQPLPIISRGGTSLLFTAISFGLMLSVSRTVESQDDENHLNTVANG